MSSTGNDSRNKGNGDNTNSNRYEGYRWAYCDNGDKKVDRKVKAKIQIIVIMIATVTCVNFDDYYRGENGNSK